MIAAQSEPATQESADKATAARAPVVGHHRRDIDLTRGGLPLPPLHPHPAIWVGRTRPEVASFRDSPWRAAGTIRPGLGPGRTRQLAAPRLLLSVARSARMLGAAVGPSRMANWRQRAVGGGNPASASMAAIFLLDIGTKSRSSPTKIQPWP